MSRSKNLTAQILIALVTLGCGLTSCTEARKEYMDSLYGAQNYHLLNYNLSQPDTTFYLDYELTEISGLSYHPEGYLLSVQDEKGILYILNENSGNVIRKVRFHKNGDYEGVEYFDGWIYVLKSNGHLYQFKLDKSDEVESIEINTPLNGKNDAEGLGVFDGNGELLIACKANSAPKGKNKFIGKSIFGYQPVEEEFDEDPRLTLDEDSIINWMNNHQVQHHSRIRVNPSAIAKHPQTGDFYVLTNTGKLLIILSTSGTVKGAFPLNPYLFRQPEGICFDPDGNMFISNEGKGRKGNIHIFSMKMKQEKGKESSVNE